MARGIPKRNPEGYLDLTAHDALSAIQAEEADQRTAKLIVTLKNTIELAGFDLLARIEVRDRETPDPRLAAETARFLGTADH